MNPAIHQPGWYAHQKLLEPADFNAATNVIVTPDIAQFEITSRFRIFCVKDRWEIQLFGRNSQSTDFIFNVMCKDNYFLPKPFESYERGERLIYQRFVTDTDISTVAKTLTDLLTRIENYKKRTDENNGI